jgi:hypothetical protein
MYVRALPTPQAPVKDSPSEVSISSELEFILRPPLGSDKTLTDSVICGVTIFYVVPQKAEFCLRPISQEGAIK